MKENEWNFLSSFSLLELIVVETIRCKLKGEEGILFQALKQGFYF
jgi:hypothetical protein